MTEHLPECPKSGCPACYEQGQQDALAGAVQRVKEYLQHDVADGWMLRGKAEGIITVVKGDTE